MGLYSKRSRGPMVKLDWLKSRKSASNHVTAYLESRPTFIISCADENYGTSTVKYVIYVCI